MSTNISYHIYHPKFCFGEILIPPPNLKGPPYHLVLDVVNGETIANVNLALSDFTDPHLGIDATPAILGTQYRFMQIIYSIGGNDTGLQVLCDRKHYHLEMRTGEGPAFSEELYCKDDLLEGQQVSVYRMRNAEPNSWDKIIENWKPVGDETVKPSLRCRFFGLCS